MLSRLGLYILISSIPLSGAGCSTTPKYEVVKPKLEISSSEQELQTLISEYPLEFKLGSAEEELAWQRANLFGDHFLGSTPVPSYHSGRDESVSLKIKSKNFEYSVTKRLKGKEFIITVSCQVSGVGTPVQADLNARNLSRFIKEGRLEVAILVN